MSEKRVMSASSTTSNMVIVRDAYKRYGKGPPILKGLNMTVTDGTIYALLGSSGCGKTTLLNCIVGLKRLDLGMIKLGITKRSQLGYMPQDIALFNDFKTSEILLFYGTLYGMTRSEVKDSSNELVKMLDLPSPNRFIRSLSGGQQRRVSFAVALLHNPQLLILDEPTVGVDPILCNNIWSYLLRISTVERKTVVITTHYIEEAKQTNTIGLMRNGVLIAEDAPKKLMASQNCTHLEEAFFQLSRKQQEILDENNLKGIKYEYPRVKSGSVESPIASKELFKMSRLVAQLFKNIRWLQGNVPIILFLLFLPLVQTYLFCVAYGHDPKNLTLGLVSDEFTNHSSNCYDPTFYRAAYSELLDCKVPKPFTCPYLWQLEEKFHVKIFENNSAARTAVIKNEIWGFVSIPSNFSQSLEERIINPLDIDELGINSSIIWASLDMSDFVISNLIKRSLQKGIGELIRGILASCNQSTAMGEIPVNIEEAIYGDNDPILTHNVGSAFICSFVVYFTMTYTSGAIMMEKMAGLVERIMVAGMTSIEIIIAHVFIQFILVTGQTIIMMCVMYIGFQHPLQGSIALIVALLYCIALVGIALGYLLSEIFKEERLVTYSCIGFLLTLFMLSGIMWPIEGAHISLRLWCRGFPIVAASEGFQSITLRGHTISNPIVYTGFASCLAWIIIFSLLSYYLAWRRKNHK